MNWDAIGAVGEILGALAVFVTLIYLAIQTRDNVKVLRARAVWDPKFPLWKLTKSWEMGVLSANSFSEVCLIPKRCLITKNT